MKISHKIITEADRQSGQEVASIRHKTRLNQNEFAERYEIGLHQLRSWERGASRPTGPSKAYLHLIDVAPKVVLDMLGSADVVRNLPVPGVIRRYHEAGLDWVALSGLTDPASVPGINELDNLISRHLIRSPVRLSGRDLRFLHARAGFDAETVLGLSPQKVARLKSDLDATLSVVEDLAVRLATASALDDLDVSWIRPLTNGSTVNTRRPNVTYIYVDGSWLEMPSLRPAEPVTSSAATGAREKQEDRYDD